MKQIQELTDDDVDQLLSIMLGREISNALVTRTADKTFVIGEYVRKRPLPPNSEKYDYIKMYITIDESFHIDNRWGYCTENSEGISTEPLHKGQFMYRYLQQAGYDIYQEDTKEPTI